MKRYFSLALLMAISTMAQAQIIHPETEDGVNSNPTRHLPINRSADTTGMANPPTTRTMPVPPPFSENYRPGTDTAPAPAPSTTPQPGFPGARMTPLQPSTVVNMIDIFEQGTSGKFRGCAITARRDRRGCDYDVIVDGRAYPFHAPEICSSNSQAAKVGCNYGNEKENAGCILNQALMIGLCR